MRNTAVAVLCAALGLSSRVEGQSPPCSAGNALGVIACALSGALEGYEKDEAVLRRRAADSLAFVRQIEADHRQAARSRASDSLNFLLFSQRAHDVIDRLADSLDFGLFPRLLMPYELSASETAVQLYSVNPNASSQAIHDQILPLTRQPATAVNAWKERFVSVMANFYTSARIPIPGRDSVLADAWRSYFAESGNPNVGDDARMIALKISPVLLRDRCVEGMRGKWDEAAQRCTLPRRQNTRTSNRPRN